MNCIGLIAATALSVVSISPASAEIVTFRSSGVIAQTAEYSFGEDGIGLFGPSGSSLLGAKFILDTTFDTTNRRVNTYDWYEQLSDTVPFDVSITINNRTYSYHVGSPVITLATVFGTLSAIGRGSDDIRFEGAGRDAEGRFVSAAHGVSTYATPFIGAPATFGATASLIPGAADYARSHFSVYGPDGIATRFQTFTLSAMELNPAPINVPEPSTLALWIAAATGLVLAQPKLFRKAIG